LGSHAELPTLSHSHAGKNWNRDLRVPRVAAVLLVETGPSAMPKAKRARLPSFGDERTDLAGFTITSLSA
jgi:hypothetical protein